METIFSREIQSGLDQARIEGLKRSSRLRVKVDGDTFTVLRMWKTGLALEAQAPTLRGFVDLYDGSRHLFRCLIVTGYNEAGERRYEFKRATAVTETAPLDFERAIDAPVALIDHKQAS
mgnify:CR=1 FL=1